MKPKFTAQQQARFLRDLENMPLESDSQLEDSFYQRETKRRQAQINEMRATKDFSILTQLQKNTKEEDQMMTEYEKDREELHKITSNEEKNVIDNTLIQAIKEKVATNNNSILALADQHYNESVIQPEIQAEPSIVSNNSFLKIKAHRQKQAEQQQKALILKLESANQQREYLAMEQEDKLSFKYEMDRLSELFKERFIRPSFPEVVEQSREIKVVVPKLPNSLVRLIPQKVSDQTVLPKNAPQIALKYLRQHKCKRKALRSSAQVEVKVNPRKLAKQKEQFEDLQDGSKADKAYVSQTDSMFVEYLKGIRGLVGEIEKIAEQYHPKFLRRLQQEEKNFNYDPEQNSGTQRNITQIASLENASSLCQLKLSLEKLTSLKGVQNFCNLEQAQFQFNMFPSVDPLNKCPKLIQLNLSHNKIKNVQALDSLCWLRMLNLEHNFVQVLEPRCTSLEVLIASNNRVEEINLNELKQLRVLHLQNNRLHNLPQLRMLGLSELNISHNQLNQLAGIQQLILLQRLDCSHNRISEINNLAFLYLHELNLSHNNLVSLTDLFLPCLQTLTLSDNRLTTKGKGTAFLPNIKAVNVDDNRLEGFELIWWLLRFAKGAQIVRYGNNQYFLGLREKVREVYQALLYRNFRALKILNDSPTDRGLAQYYRQNYSIYFQGSSFFMEPGPVLTKIEAMVRLLLRQSTLSLSLQSKSDPFVKQQAYVDYQWKCKLASLKQVISLSQNNTKPLLVPPTLFYRYDSHQQERRRLYHLLRGALLKRQLRIRRKQKYFMKLKPRIVELLDSLNALYIQSERSKIIGKFKMLLKGLNEDQAAIKIQKVWKGYIRRKLYHKLKYVKNHADDSDQDVDIDFFNNQLEKVEFDVDLEDFEDIIIRPEVFEMLQARQKESQSKSKAGKKEGKKEDKEPMMNNFLESRTKLSNQPKKQPKQDEAQKLMREWRIKDPKVLQALQFKQQKKQAMKRKQQEKTMTAAERFQRFKRGGY